MLDLHQIFENAELLQSMARDMHSDVKEVIDENKAVCLIGDQTHNLDRYPTEQLIETLCLMAQGERQLWELQYMFMVCAYLSDSVVDWVATMIPPYQFKYWFDGHDTLCGFRQRFEQHLLGKFSKKAKKGQRKVVVLTATLPQMAAVDEYLLAHTIVTWNDTPYNRNLNTDARARR